MRLIFECFPVWQARTNKELLPISMQFSQHVLEGTFAEGLNVCMFDCGHLGPLSHRGHDPTRSTCEEKAGSTLCAITCSSRLVAELKTFQVDGFFGDLFD